MGTRSGEGKGTHLDRAQMKDFERERRQVGREGSMKVREKTP